MRSFEFARKMKDGVPVTELDERNVSSEIKAFKDAQLPEYQTTKSAGADFFCAEEVVIKPIWESVFSVFGSRLSNALQSLIGQQVSNENVSVKKAFAPTFIHTGIKSNMEKDEVLLLYNRSSNPKKLGLILANGVGVVDADYYGNIDNDGEIMFAFYNILPWSVTIHVGDRVGQGVFQKYLRPEEGLRVKDVERVGGVGSTDKE